MGGQSGENLESNGSEKLSKSSGQNGDQKLLNLGVRAVVSVYFRKYVNWSQGLLQAK